MNVLMLNPPFKGKFSRTSRSPAVTLGGTIYYPFWLAYAAGVLEQNGFSVQLIDAPAQGLSDDDVLERAKSMPPQLIVIDTSTPSIYRDVKVAEQLKESFPSSFIALVGTHPSALPEETLKLSARVDAVAVGEYDYTMRDLAFCLDKDDDLKTVDGLVFRKDGQIMRNRPRALIENVDELPFVSQVYKRHLNIHDYRFAAANYPMVMLITGRGCPYKCFFCVYPQTFHSRKYRPRSAANVVDEFQWITENLPEVKEIGIEDDTFTVDQERVKEICRLILDRGIKVKWYCNVRVNLGLETMRWMKKAGCRLVTVGFESADQESLDLMQKGITVAQIRQFVRDTREAGLLVHGCFIIGNRGETAETMEQSLMMAKELNCDTMQFFPLLVYPGTEAYRWAKENGYLAADSFAEWADEGGMYRSVLNIPGLPAEKVEAFCLRANREYYLRPGYILMKLKQLIFGPREVKRTLAGALTYFRRLPRSYRSRRQ
ncbi:MAG TPA: radical SAM protein [Dehalococcoidia bacterium]|nr:radical SAM protein [Dehalococcoidia bacterium]